MVSLARLVVSCLLWNWRPPHPTAYIEASQAPHVFDFSVAHALNQLLAHKLLVVIQAEKGESPVLV
jgi:hypothetical protein